MGQRNTDYNFTGEPSIHSNRSWEPQPTKANISTTVQVETQEKRLINGMEFVSVKNEIERYYDVPTGKGGSTVRVTIKRPQWLFVRSSGSHQVIDDEGYAHYIPNSFVHLAWKQKPEADAAEF
jgi:hypothetical protein